MADESVVLAKCVNISYQISDGEGLWMNLSASLQIRMHDQKLVVLFLQKHMLWMLKRTDSARRFFRAPTHALTNE